MTTVFLGAGHQTRVFSEKECLRNTYEHSVVERARIPTSLIDAKWWKAYNLSDSYTRRRALDLSFRLGSVQPYGCGQGVAYEATPRPLTLLNKHPPTAMPHTLNSHAAHRSRTTKRSLSGMASRWFWLTYTKWLPRLAR